MVKYLFLLAAMVVALAATNPGAEAHRKQMVEHAKASCGESALEKTLCGGVAELFSGGVEYHSYLLFSTARFGKAESLGLLGNVVVTKG